MDDQQRCNEDKESSHLSLASLRRRGALAHPMPGGPAIVWLKEAHRALKK
jgi:hypothetical protein